jgi:drug/metabolite transporter (DMT)-like permease
MQLHDDDIPGDQTPVQRFEFGKSLVIGVVVVVLGGILTVVGITQHQNPMLPAFACIAGVLILGFDLSTRRSRRRQRGK